MRRASRLDISAPKRVLVCRPAASKRVLVSTPSNCAWLKALYISQGSWKAALANREVLEDGNVPVVDPRATNHIFGSVADRSLRRTGDDAGIEEALECPLTLRNHCFSEDNHPCSITSASNV